MTRRFPVPLAAVLAGSLGFASPAAAAPRVAVDIAPVHALVAQVMEGVGEPALILPPTATPHAYALRPSEASALDRADVVVWVGAELTPWLEGALDTLAGEAEVITLLGAGGSTVREVRTGLAFEVAGTGHEDHDDHGHEGHGHETHDGHAEHAHENHAGAVHGHDHAHDHDGADPHAWLDPVNARAWLEVIAAELSAQDPQNAARYKANARAAAEDLRALETRITERLAPVRGTPYLVYHDAYQYFEARFGVSPAGALALGDAADPGPARMAALRDLAEETGVACIFGEPQFSGARVASIFGDTVGHAVLDPLGSGHTPGPGLYASMLGDMADAIAACLSRHG